MLGGYQRPFSFHLLTQKYHEIFYAYMDDLGQLIGVWTPG